MNPNLDDSHASIQFYDSDYPMSDGPLADDNFDATVVAQGLAFDVERYCQIAGDQPIRILDLCTGTGRIAIPLARAGHTVTGVDISKAMLEGFSQRLQVEDKDIAARIDLVSADISTMSLDRNNFDLATIGFNSLMCLPDFDLQQTALQAAADHLKPGGKLVLDLMNPHILNLKGDAFPTPFFTRRNPKSGKMYTRFAMMGPIDTRQVQELSGWYDEYESDGTVRRHFYSMEWRPIYQFELSLMLEKSGFEIISVEGGHKQEQFEATSKKMFVLARRK